MIQFPCPGCGQVFSVDDDEAGRGIQCSRCSRLSDVPTHSELSSLAEDGTFKLIEPTGRTGEDPSVVAETARAFGKARVDETGAEIDLRNTPEELAGLNEPTALEPGQKQRYKPRYDPETGELVRPLDLVPDDRDTPPELIPIAVPFVQAAPPAVINYAPVRDPELNKHTTLRRLFEPVNLAVMGFVLIGLAFGYVVQLFLVAIMEQLFEIPTWPLNIMFWLAASHLGNTIVAIGPEEHDMLPRPLRSLELWDDILGPLVKVLGAVLICYAPMFAVLAIASGPASAAALPLMLIGGYYFPAVVLTLMTSGSIANLHPSRIQAVIRIGGKRYILLAVGWIIAFPVYLLATLRVNLIFDMLSIDPAPYTRIEILLAAPLAVLSVFYLHYFCWQLGLLYRVGHDRFGWAWQEFQRQREEEQKQRGGMTAADRAAMRRQRQQRAAAAAAGQAATPGQARQRLDH